MSFLKQLRKKSTRRAVEYHRGAKPVKNCEELLFRATELGGEAGEALDAIKKYARLMKNMEGGVGKKESTAHIKEELGDVIICVDRVAEFFGFDLEEVVREKFNKTSVKRGFKTKF